MSAVKLDKTDTIAIIRVANPPVNAISAAVRAGIVDALDQIAKDPDVTAIVLLCEGRTFMAGADITEFGGPPKKPTFADVLAALDAASHPIVAAIHGTAFGGGLELALTCHYRLAVPSANVGLPEVKLGLLPGAGGTQRLPRAAGVDVALDAIVSGDPIPASVALQKGIIDQVHNGDSPLEDAAIAYAKSLVADGAPLRRLSDIPVETGSLPDDFFDSKRKAVARSHRNLFAPQRCIDAVEAAATLPFDAGMKRERELFEACAAHPQSKALQYAFFAERQTTRVPDLPSDTATRPITRVGVVGAGTMGGGIAMSLANAGIPVRLLEVSSDALERGVKTIRANYQRSAERGRLTPAEVGRRTTLIDPTTNYGDLADCDLIIEAVFERMAVKKEVFASLDRIAKPGAILATNTSYLNIDEIAAHTSRPGDVLGLHFFSPANVMRLLEIVRGAETSPDVLATAIQLSKTMGKVGVIAGVCHGFIGNRMLEGYGREAGLLVLEGASPQQVDKALYDFGYPMGPLAVSDLAGMDIGYMLRASFPADRFDPNAYRVANRLVDMGRKGQKTGAGMYRYEAGNRTPIPDPEVMSIIEEEAAAAGIQRREISDEEIVERCVLPLVNEGARILEEGIAIRPGDIDMVYLYGYGFPRWRGGPMYWADAQGLDWVLERIRHYSTQQGARWWTPAPLLEKLAGEGRRFADWQAS